jgi:hypothetical protein
MTRSRHLLPLLPLVVVAVYVGFAVMSNGDDEHPAPIAIEATGPRFAAFHDLVVAGDGIVAGEVVDVRVGRTLTDPADPTAGIVTQLVTLRVDRVLRGTAKSTIVIEQEASLADGTPIVVNGLPPLAYGEVGIAVYLDRIDDEFPYAALVNEQAWLAVRNGFVDTGRSDAVAVELDGQSVDAVTSLVERTDE